MYRVGANVEEARAGGIGVRNRLQPIYERDEQHGVLQ